MKWSNGVGSTGIEGKTVANGVGLDVDSNIKTREFISVGITSTSLYLVPCICIRLT